MRFNMDNIDLLTKFLKTKEVVDVFGEYETVHSISTFCSGSYLESGPEYGYKIKKPMYHKEEYEIIFYAHDKERQYFYCKNIKQVKEKITELISEL